ncbi:impB/mucB/samB family protein [Diaporthe helianthi]|uniref:ImpB/mucB/samB family protein n=1 Tax=Diaporthe helianthi TaxID=158607 RepID=A0A2P5I5C2_DIAHE|nr:impB/mucB/samB family protein [Diaporthe helianthi]
MEQAVRRRSPRRKQDRIILHFDYDCFYAQVVENAQPALKSMPLGIKQKSILATCNYVARKRGVKKLQLISDAKKVCPDLVLADGEDLSAFRDVSKKLYGLLKSFSWNKKAERLGLDEVFLDVTDLVEFNLGLLNRNALSDSFFCLSRDNPENGFSFDATAIAGSVTGNGHGEDNHDNFLFVKLLLASHVARHMRLKIEEEGYTSACGISTNKVLSKLAGTVNKPRNQTTLISIHEDETLKFMDSFGLRQVPGIGGRITHSLESYFLGREADANTFANGSAVTVGEFRTRPEVSPHMLEKLLGSRPGAEKGIGDKVWALLHGVDNMDVKAASSIPTQISIEDTYPGQKGGLNTLAEVERELLKLSASLLRRMHVDLTETDEPDMDSAESAQGPRRTKWLAHPKTLRLSTRPKTSPNEGTPYNWGRASRSHPLPTFVFHDIHREIIAGRLVKEALFPMFFQLNPEKPEGWDIGMINVCVANMSLAATDDAYGSGRDISRMFKRQDEALREFKVYDDGSELPPKVTQIIKTGGDSDRACPDPVVAGGDDVDFGDDYASESEPEAWGDQDGSQCPRCGHYLPEFALSAHLRYHVLEEP